MEKKTWQKKVYNILCAAQNGGKCFQLTYNSTIYIEHKFTHCSTIKATNAIPLSSFRPFLFAPFVSFYLACLVPFLSSYPSLPTTFLPISQPYFHVSNPIRSPTYCYRTYSDFDPFYSNFFLLELFVAQYVRVYECECLFHRLHTPVDCKAQQKNFE